MRFKATKISLFLLAGRYTKLPKAMETVFSKDNRADNYRLRWDGGKCEAYFSSFDGVAILRIKTPCGIATYYPAVKDLRERGMVDEGGN